MLAMLFLIEVPEPYQVDLKEIKIQKRVALRINQMVILVLSLCVFRMGWVAFIMPYFSTIDGVFVLYPVSWILGMILMALYTWKGKWFSVQEKMNGGI